MLSIWSGPKFSAFQGYYAPKHTFRIVKQASDNTVRNSRPVVKFSNSLPEIELHTEEYETNSFD